MNSNNITAVNKTCRTCLENAKVLFKFKAKLVIKGNVFTIETMLHACTDIKITKHSDLPKRLCSTCILSLYKAFLFRLQAREAQSTLENINNKALEPETSTINNSNTKLDNSFRTQAFEFIGPSPNNQNGYAEKIINSNIDQKLLNDNNINKVLKVKLNCLPIGNLIKTRSTMDEMIPSFNGNFPTVMQNMPLKLEEPFMHNDVKTSGATDTKKISLTEPILIKDESICLVCLKSFFTADAFQEHQNTYHSLMKCNVCEEEFEGHYKLIAHQKKTAHTNVKTYMCENCGKQFKSKVHLEVHFLSHDATAERKKFVCDICGKTFCSAAYLSSHIGLHTGNLPFKCNICDRGFTAMRHLRDHSRTHSGEKPFVCSICDKAFAVKTALRNHISRHLQYKPNKCDVCDYASVTKDDLVIHKRGHAGEYPYPCTFEGCKKKFTSSGHRQKHLQIHSKYKKSNPKRPKSIIEKIPIHKNDCVTRESISEYLKPYDSQC